VEPLRGAHHIFGYPAAESVEQTLDLIVPQPMRERHWRGFRGVMQTGATRYATSVLPAPALNRTSGTSGVKFTIGVLRSNGEIRGAVAILRDVTAREREDRALRRRLRERERRLQP
jgi:PAS domain S-box-containing protein